MSSGSEDEFFDAAENLSLSRSISLLSQRQENIDSTSDVVSTPVSKFAKLQLEDRTDISPNNARRKESIEAISSESDVKILEVDNVSEETSCRKESGEANNHMVSENKGNLRILVDAARDEGSKETAIFEIAISKETENTESRTNDDLKTSINCNEGSKQVDKVSVPTTPEGPAPIAPPRKKRHTKKETKPKELIFESAMRRNNVLLISSSNTEEADPCIDLKLSTNEMDRVLERGNSLDVVYNDDLMTRKSGGLSPVKPEISVQALSTTNCEANSDIGEQIESHTADSGRPLTDAEILEQVIIKNLDTGETIPLSQAEETLPECTNPLTLHIYRLATEQNSAEMLPPEQGDEDGHISDVSTASGGRMQGKRKKLKRFFGRTVQKIKSVADELQVRKPDETSSSEDEQVEDDDGYIKFKHHRMKKEKLMFDRIKLLQDLSGEHIGAVWTMKFSLCGKLLATAGQDNIVRVWVLKNAAQNFEEMRKKYSRPMGRSSPTGSMASSNSTTSAEDDLQIDYALHADDSEEGPFRSHPFVRYHGHTSDVLDLSWSKNYFLLSSSMDKTVRLWHISRQECLCCFQHVDFVTAICFHPRDDRYFLSGSLDGKIRLWNIPEKKVALWNEIDGYGTSLVTAANFCRNGKLAVVGTYDGRCIFYDTEKLKYHTQVTVRSSRGKNARGRKISGIEPMPGEDKVLITSNDSRIRLYDLNDHSLYCKYKGLQNESSQIRATFSRDGKLILCGSEDKYVYIWRTNHDLVNVRKDRNEYYESFSAHEAVVTAAIFAPYPNTIIERPNEDGKSISSVGTYTREFSPKPYEITVAADWQGGVKLYINR